jgi:hypothetical protein
MLVSVSILFDFRELRREAEGVSASGSVWEEGFGCRRELSAPLLRPPLLRFDGCGVDFSSMGSDGGPVEDMAAAALPFVLLERVFGCVGGS